MISTTYNIQQSSKEQSRTILQHRKSLQQLSRLEKEELLDLQQKKFKLLNSSSFNSSIPTKAYNFSFESKNIFALFLILSIILIAATYLSIGSIASNNSEDQSFFHFLVHGLRKYLLPEMRLPEQLLLMPKKYHLKLFHSVQI